MEAQAKPVKVMATLHEIALKKIHSRSSDGTVKFTLDESFFWHFIETSAYGKAEL